MFLNLHDKGHQRLLQRHRTLPWCFKTLVSSSGSVDQTLTITRKSGVVVLGVKYRFFHAQLGNWTTSIRERFLSFLRFAKLGLLAAFGFDSSRARLSLLFLRWSRIDIGWRVARVVRIFYPRCQLFSPAFFWEVPRIFGNFVWLNLPSHFSIYLGFLGNSCGLRFPWERSSALLSKRIEWGESPLFD